MSKLDTKTIYTKHSIERCKQRFGYKDDLQAEIKLVKRYGVRRDFIPEKDKYKSLKNYLQKNKMYYNGYIYVFETDSYYKLLTLYACPSEYRSVGEDLVQKIKKARQPKSKVKRNSTDGLLRSNIKCKGCGLELSIMTNQGKISYVYFGSPKKDYPETAKPSFVDYLQKDFTNHIEKGQKLMTGVDLTGYSSEEILVFNEVSKIKYGHVKTYGEVAKATGLTPSKVSKILNNCNLALVIPTHRVISTRNRLGTYRWRASTKRRILIMENKEFKKLHY